MLEADSVVGGISRTVERDGWRFDIGGHRFFTKVPEVEAVWHEILPDDDFLLRPRMSRIYYQSKFFDYPLRATNALKTLGLRESFLCGCSYLGVRIKKPKDQTTFEGWIASRFGWRLYRMFFKTYTEKVWGVPADKLPADWAAQRIKNLSLGKAVDQRDPARGATRRRSPPSSRSSSTRSTGPGMMWEVCTDKVEAAGTKVLMETVVTQVEHKDGRAVAVTAETEGVATTYDATAVISSMPMSALAAGDGSAAAGRGARRGRCAQVPRLPHRRARRPRQVLVPRQLDLRALARRASSVASRTSGTGRRTW